MTRRLPVTRPPAPRVIHYVDPATPAEMAYPWNPAELAVRQQRDAVLVARWKKRQEALAKRDRKVRQFWLGFGAVFALILLAALIVLGWLLWAVLGLGVLALPVVALTCCAVAVGGHKCVTVVQHWH
jgi:uncharacterized membrane protein YdbT with pleckstrin-like domain